MPRSSRDGSVIGLWLLLFSLAAFGAHELYHFADWLDWGLGHDWLANAREGLFPAFGAHDLFGYVSHAGTSALTLAGLLWAFLRASRVVVAVR